MKIITTFLAVAALALACSLALPSHSTHAAEYKPAAATSEKSLYERLGGQEAIDAVVDIFYVKVLADERVNFFCEDVNMNRQIVRQKQFLAAAFGGPKPYEGRDLRAAHASLDIEEKDFNVIAEHLQASLKDAEVDQKLIDEVMAIAASTKDAVLNRESKDS